MNDAAKTAQTIDAVVADLPRFKEAAEKMRESFLAHLTMIGETGAPTFDERERATIFAERLAEGGLQDCSVDGKNNAIGVLPGTEASQNLLLAAHGDTLPEERSSTIQIQIDRVIGPFVGDNAIGLAALATLPMLLERLNVRLRSNLVVLAAARTLGRGNLEGVKHFLAESGMKFAAGLCVESVQLGRLNYSSIGMFRGEIVCRLPEEFDWAQFGSGGTIIPMADVIARIGRIPFPSRPVTSIIIGSVEGGISHGNIARETRLGFEVRSEDPEILRQIREQIEDVTEDVTGQSGTKVTLDIFAQREAGGIDIAHPLVRNARAILTALGLQPSLYATTSLMSALRDAGIPALTLGITTGQRESKLEEIEESVAIAPMAVGMAQLVAMLMAADGGTAP